MNPCDMCGVKPKLPGRGRRRCEDCDGLCKKCSGPLDQKSRCPACIRDRNRERYQTDPAYARSKNISTKLSLYGITREEYDSLDWRCQVCGKNEGKLCIDHDHETGKVRGVLCSRCNSALGLLDEDVERMKNLIRYTEETKCQ